MNDTPSATLCSIFTCRRLASLLILCCVVLAVLGVPAGCSSPGSTGQPRPQSTNGSVEALDLGEDWDARGSRRGASAAVGRQRLEKAWTIVLGTFSGEGHAEVAQAVQRQIAQHVPELATARVHSTERGSMLLFGGYDSADGGDATADLARIKELTLVGQPAFARAFLSPTPKSARAAAPRSEFALMAVRERHPNVDPLYTLQVAVWDDFESGSLSRVEVQSQAEAYTRQLRAQGHEAYVYHDDRLNQSLVTVGLFDRTFLDASTGEFGPEMRRLREQFPALLVNGEPLQRPIDRQRPGRGTRVQETFLVKVPRPD